MTTAINQQSLINIQSARLRPLTFYQSHNPSAKKTQRDVLPESQNRKNYKSKKAHIVLQQLKIDDSKENSLKKSNPKIKQPSNSLQINKELSAPSPFNNLSNFRPHHLDPLDINSTKNQVIDHNFINMQSPQNSPKLSQKQRQICQKLYQKKLSNNQAQTKRKSFSHRITVTSSKDKENNFKKVNLDNLIHQNQAILNLKQNNQQKQIGKPEFSQIDNHILPSLVSSRQKSSHSFLIRKKIASTSLVGQKPDQNSQKPFNLPSNYRKDRFIREQKDDFIQQMTEPKSQKNQNHQFQKYESEQSKIKQECKNEEIKTQRVDNQTSDKILKNGKSLKVRKGRYSRAQQLAVQKQKCYQKNNINESQKKSKFRSTIQDYLEIKKIHQMQTKAAKMIKISQENGQKKEKSVVENSTENQKAFQNDKQQQIQEKRIDQSKKTSLAFPQNLKQSSANSNEDRPLTNSQLKVFRKRVSSIRALKNCFKNFHTEEQSQFLTDSRIAEPTKRKQKQAACLTHKIKWGINSRKKSISQKGIEFVNNLNSEIIVNQKRSQKKIKEQISNQRPDFIKQSKKQAISPNKKAKKLRFSDELEEIDIDSPYKNGIIKVISKQESSLYLQRPDNFEQVYSIGSRSMIVFDDPGISIIVRKDSSAQSSDLQPNYNTIDKNLHQDDQCLEINQMMSNKKHNKNSDNIKLQSLRQLFIELKSHKSIYLPDDKQQSQKMSILQEEEQL